MNDSRPITELPNCLTSDIDLASPTGIVRLLRQADAQLFAGYSTWPGLGDEETLYRINFAARRAAEILREPRGVVVMSGAGTSGRLALLAAREFNPRFSPPGFEKFRFLIAGGHKALIQAQEGAEDDPAAGHADLDAITADATHVYYIGITCGLSAPYVAGQLEALFPRDNAFSLLLGFNPVKLARTTHTENWEFTFKQTAERMKGLRNAAVLNPIVGPEPITGSTRMKSGSATKIALELIFHAAHLLMEKDLSDADMHAQLLKWLGEYEQATIATYNQGPRIASLIELGAEALRQKGRIIYFGNAGKDADGLCHNAGVLGLIDASECPPTYGARFDDVRGFLRGGWLDLFPDGSTNLSAEGAHFRVGFADFLETMLPTITRQDLCVMLGEFDGRTDLEAALAERGARIASVTWQKDPNAPTVAASQASCHVVLEDTTHPELGRGTLDLQIKLVLNALTTGAHVLTGKVFGNRMVDLRISNSKLYHRTVGIISDLMKVSTDAATEALMRSIFQTDDLTAEQRQTPVSRCIDLAKDVEKVVPKALLLASGKFTNKSAAAALKQNPIVRALLAELLSAGN